jgi:hypothetical protein
MSNSFKILVSLLAIGIVSSNFIHKAIASDSDSNEKNKMPCLEGICIGDDIQSLKDISWVSADKKLGKNKNYGWKIVGSPKVLQSLLPYLSGQIIDRNGINLLHGIKGFCTIALGGNIFSGYLQSKDGKPIEVRFNLVALSNDKEQKIIVTEIRKRIATTDIGSQRESLQSEVERRYPSSNKILSRTNAVVQSSMSGGEIKAVYLRLYSKGMGSSASALLEFPGCIDKVGL